MRTLTIILDADDTPKSIATLAALGTAIEGFSNPDTLHTKAHNIVWFRVYAEEGNDIDATNGPARIGFEQSRSGTFKTSRVLATQHGTRLIPGFFQDFLPFGGGSANYDFSTAAISGKTGDQFQIHYGTL